MGEEKKNQQPVYIVQRESPETEAAATTASILEIAFGLFSVLGVGHVYTGRIGLGIALMFGWWIFVSIGVVISTITAGLAACIFGPLYIAVPIISGVQARKYMRIIGGSGSWSSVGMVAGVGCLLVIIAFVIILVSLGFFGAYVTSY